MTPVDPYSMTNKLDDGLIKVVVTRLEARSKHPMFVRMLQDYLDAMQIDTAKTVLDMGCGTGVAARAIARRPRFAGTVTGIDLSPSLAATHRIWRRRKDSLIASSSGRETRGVSTSPTPRSTRSSHTRSSAMSTTRGPSSAKPRVS